MTIHSSKGLEFEQVCILASNYNIYNEKDIEEHYVATTRAKNKFIIVNDDNWYLLKVKSICKKVGVELNDIANLK